MEQLVQLALRAIELEMVEAIVEGGIPFCVGFLSPRYFWRFLSTFRSVIEPTLHLS